MARAHFVKKARKANKAAGIKKGDSYWWWAFMVGGRGGPKHYSKTRPRPSQLTQSSFLSGILAAQEAIEDLPVDDIDAIVDGLEGIKGDVEGLGDECDSSLQNMPEGLQQGPTGELLQSRVDACQEVCSSIDDAISEIESLRDEEEEKDNSHSDKISTILGDIDFGSIE